jgi:hypothetical protein
MLEKQNLLSQQYSFARLREIRTRLGEEAYIKCLMESMILTAEIGIERLRLSGEDKAAHVIGGKQLHSESNEEMIRKYERDIERYTRNLELIKRGEWT